MTKTIIVSDIHLGARNSRPDLLLELLHTDFDHLIVNGDTIDNLNLKRFRPADWAVLDRLRRIARERHLVLIRGNHDGSNRDRHELFGPSDVLAELLEVELLQEFCLWVGSRRYVVLHGDQFDRTLNLTWLGDAADSCYQLLQVCSRPLARWLKHRVKRWGGVVRCVKAGALEYARNRNCRGVVAGHTHFEDDDWAEGVHYLNTGCWVDWPCTYVRIDGSEVGVFQWLGSGRKASGSKQKAAGRRHAIDRDLLPSACRIRPTVPDFIKNSQGPNSVFTKLA